jgi:Na+/H+-dicarboxylate symporter
MVIIGWVMKLAPYGVFALSAAVFASFGAELLGSLLMFCLTVIVGELLFAFGVFGIAIRVFIGMNPLSYFRKIARRRCRVLDVVVERGACRSAWRSPRPSWVSRSASLDSCCR